MALPPESKATKREQIYRQLGQGLKVFHEHSHPDVDFLAVPGLGTNPQECWTWTPNRKASAGRSAVATPAASSDNSEAIEERSGKAKGYNWVRDPDGLASLFPKSRIMLYDYASAWRGSRKVKATMKGICSWLLDDLREKRKGTTEIGRPLIIIAHSMGGVVAAKTLCMARARSEFESILTCTIGCLFFGAPFRGTDMAKIALLYSSVFGLEAYESLLNFMRAEKNDTLEEVTNDFMEICGKLMPPIDLVCAYEQVPTDVSYAQRMTEAAPRLLQHKAFKASTKAILDLGGAAFKTGTHFVEQESAVLQGSHSIGLTADHRDLIKFESVTSEKFSPIRGALTKMVQMSKTNARKRVLLSGQNLLSQRAINQVRQSLEGVDMRLKYRTKVNERKITSWLTAEQLYSKWLSRGSQTPEDCSYLWLKGAAGLGKTNAALAAIQEINRVHIEEQHSDGAHGQPGILMAFFLCEWVPGCNTAEELLQSLITQIINQDESLAQHGARWFVPNTRDRSASHGSNDLASAGTKATTTVDNLWMCLQDMLEDPSVNNIHLIINNIHILESSSSTNTLLSKLRDDADKLKHQTPATRRIKWLVTSRNDRHISQHLNAASISTIDLENDHEYGAKLKDAQRKHTREAILRLRSSKSYDTELAWWVRNSIDSLSEDETWVDVFCILLGNMPNDTSSLTIRKWVKEVSAFNIHELIDYAWDRILSQNEATKLELEELLRALTIAYEPPTMADLAVLTQIKDTASLFDLVRSCSPVLEIGSTGENQGKVIFTNAQFAQRLQITSHGHPDASGSSQRRRHHGTVALRCFYHIKASLSPAVSGRHSRLLRSSKSQARFDDTNLIDLNDDEDDFYEPEFSSSSLSACPYPIKYLFRHLSEGFPDVAQDLCEQDPGFWGQESSLRDAWLKEYQDLTNEVKDLSTHGMSALHVAAGIGAKELVSILVSQNGRQALSWTSDDGMTPLHVAASSNQKEVVDALVRIGADIELGDGTSGTALHLAALHGNSETMTMLIREGANINATSRDIGPVINAAILSGTVDAVKLIMDGDVRFDLDYTKCDAPLSLSARLSEPSLFQDILETGRGKWLQNVKLLDQALVAASYNGRLESVRILLSFPHTYTNNTMEKAVLSAATEKKWASVNEILDHVMGSAGTTRWQFRVDEAFYLASTNREERIEILEKMWSFSRQRIAQEILDYSLYQATVMRKETTVVWLLETCTANPNATAAKPYFTESANAAPLIDYSNALNAAASSGNADLVKSLLEKGAIIDNDHGYALQLAAGEGHNKVVQTLLLYGAVVDKMVQDSDEVGFFSGTALQVACENERIDVVQTLLSHGANPNLGGGPSSNPITAATERGLSEVLRVLLHSRTIDVNVFGGAERSTPLINAAIHMPTEILELLLKRNADVNAQNAAGDTALIMAALRGDKTSVETLCNHGADVTYRSPQRGLAIQVAAKAQNALCASVLAERMASVIEHLRETGSAEAATASERLANIELLNGLLADTREQLELKSKDMESFQIEKQQLESMGAMQGETYVSIEQQMRAIESERTELSKQLSATKGQLGLANGTISRVKKLLDEEREANADLRKRQGWAALQEAQEERNAAIGMLEQEKQALVDASNLAEEDRKHLYDHISALENEIEVLKGDNRTVRGTLEALRKAAAEQWEIEKDEKLKLQSELEALRQKHSDEVDETLAVLQAASAKEETLEARQKATTEQWNADKEEKEVLQSELLALRIHSVELEQDLAAARAATNTSADLEDQRRAATDQWNTEKAAREKLQAELETLQNHSKEVEQTLAAVLAASVEAANQVPKVSDRTVSEGDYFESGTANVNDVSQNAPGMNGNAFRKSTSNHSLLSQRSENSPTGSAATSPRSPQSPGFRTIHGQHRPDGSLGGYRRYSSMSVRASTESLSASSTINGSSKRTSSTPGSPLSPQIKTLAGVEEEVIPSIPSRGANGTPPALPPRMENGRSFRVV